MLAHSVVVVGGYHPLPFLGPNVPALVLRLIGGGLAVALTYANPNIAVIHCSDETHAKDKAD